MINTMFKSNFEKLLDKVTNNQLLEPDWLSILEICDTIRQKDIQPKIALKAIKKKLKSPNLHTAMFSLLVLECCVKNCGQLVHDEVGTKLFMKQMRETIKTTPHENVKNKLLELLQTWTFAFRAIPKYGAIQDTVNLMKAEGYKFSALKESDAMFSSNVAPGLGDSDYCHQCRVKFGMFQHKYHCRACEQVFCAQCLSRYSTLPKFGNEIPVRVCEACYEKLQKSQLKKEAEDLPKEYLTSSLIQQNQILAANRKTEEELTEEEQLQYAIDLSLQFEEKLKKDTTNTMKAEGFTYPALNKSDAMFSSDVAPGWEQEQEMSMRMEHQRQEYIKNKYIEKLQDKLVQIEDACATLDAKKDDHKAALQQEADDFAEQQRQIQLAMELDVSRQRKHQYQQYQHQMTLQQVQQHEQEMSMWMEHQRQNYINNSMYGHSSLPCVPTAPPLCMLSGHDSLMSSQMQENDIRYPQSTESGNFQQISQPQGFVGNYTMPPNPSTIPISQSMNIPSNEPTILTQVNPNIPLYIYQPRMCPMTGAINSEAPISSPMSFVHHHQHPSVGAHPQTMMADHQQPQMPNMVPQHPLPAGWLMISIQYQQPMIGQIPCVGTQQIPSQQMNPQPSAPNQVEQSKVEQPQVADLISFD